MRDRNEVYLRGRIGKAPKYTEGSSDTQGRISFRMCTNSTYVKKDGTAVEKSEWHNVVAWGKTADNAAKYLVKGQQIEISAGKLQTREYETTSGNTRMITEIIAPQIEYGLKPKVSSETSNKEEEDSQPRKTQSTIVRKKSNGIVVSNDHSDEDSF